LDYLIAFLAGGLVFGWIGWLLGNIRQERNNLNAPNRPLVVKTEQTPNQVLAKAGRARLRLFGWWLLLFVTGAVFLGVAFGVVAWIGI
jgi:1-acyl-sn-glycerol-3-phosphate acyltransferase